MSYFGKSQVPTAYGFALDVHRPHHQNGCPPSGWIPSARKQLCLVHRQRAAGFEESWKGHLVSFLRSAHDGWRTSEASTDCFIKVCVSFWSFLVGFAFSTFIFTSPTFAHGQLRQRFLVQLHDTALQGRQHLPYDLIFVDEVGFIDAPTFEAILAQWDFSGRRSLLLFAGDEGQLRPPSGHEAAQRSQRWREVVVLQLQSSLRASSTAGFSSGLAVLLAFAMARGCGKLSAREFTLIICCCDIGICLFQYFFA